MSTLLTVATRPGRLAIAQAQVVVSAIKSFHPDIQIQIKTVTTAGDRDRRTALWNLKDSGFFTSQVEDALLTGQADIAVHSFKDLPTRSRAGLTVASVLDRRFPEDCLVAANRVDSLDQLPPRTRVGTSSLRRAAQLRHIRPDIQLVPIRGNVLTRLKHVESGKVDAIILARAGLERLGLGDRISLRLDPHEFIPAPAQGALAVQIRESDTDTRRLLTAIDDRKARTTTFAERQVLVRMQCGCHAPVGAFAQYHGERITIVAFIADIEGTKMIRRQVTGPAEQAMALAEKIAAELLDSGGREILQSQNT